ncbi:hypothetical protein OQA88_734 [Cercophora sp. LCS_1]
MAQDDTIRDLLYEYSLRVNISNITTPASSKLIAAGSGLLVTSWDGFELRPVILEDLTVKPDDAGVYDWPVQSGGIEPWSPTMAYITLGGGQTLYISPHDLGRPLGHPEQKTHLGWRVRRSGEWFPQTEEYAEISPKLERSPPLHGEDWAHVQTPGQNGLFQAYESMIMSTYFLENDFGEVKMGLRSHAG